MTTFARDPALAARSVLGLAALTLVGACPDAMTGAGDATAGDATVVDAGDAADAAVEPCPEALAGHTRCAGDGRLESCVGGVWDAAACPGVTVCDGGACLPVICASGDSHCAGDAARAVCNATGTRFVDEACAASVCRDGACVAGCAVGARRCDGEAIVECGPDLVETTVATCDAAAGEACAGGRCLTECERQGLKRGYIACDFWAADLPNDESALDNIFAFAFSSASARAATVTVTYPWGPVETVTVPVGGVATHALPVPRTLSQIAGPGLARKGFRITSDEPIAAFMFNPLERWDAGSDATVATNDASILVPAPALGTDYLAVTWSDPAEFSRPPFVTVVATHDDTHVVVTPTEAVAIPQSPFLLPAGVATTLTLQAHETLDLEPPGTRGVRTDLTGTRVASLDHPIAVFSGNRCARVPDVGRFCDHIETQLPPLDTWGTDFVATKFTDRGGELDYFRVLASEDGTELAFDPPRAGAPVLAAGQAWQLSSREGFALTASKPVLLAQFMASQSMTTPPGPFGVSESCPPEIGGTCQGDPSLVLVAPTAQWRRDQVFLLPDTYQHQFINVALPLGATITLDGAPVDASAAVPIGDGIWRALTLPSVGGYHTLVASEAVAVVVYGYDHNISYAYNGGLDFRRLRGE